jgi:hypothetical protein
VSPAAALAAASQRPAAVLGLDTAPGTVELDADLHVVGVSREGRRVYRRES